MIKKNKFLEIVVRDCLRDRYKFFLLSGNLSNDPSPFLSSTSKKEGRGMVYLAHKNLIFLKHSQFFMKNQKYLAHNSKQILMTPIIKIDEKSIPHSLITLKGIG